MVFITLLSAFQHDCRRNLSVGSFWYYDGLRAFNHVVRYNHVASYRQTVHEIGIVGYCHLAVAYGPVAVFAQYLSVVVAGIGSPVLGVYKVCSFESFI